MKSACVHEDSRVSLDSGHWFPKCAPRIPRDARQLPWGYVNTFCNFCSEVDLFFKLRE